jgi:ATP adenylyltransferase
MERLWAPWRMAYITQQPRPGCLFCRVLEDPTDPDSDLVVWRPEGAIVMLNKFLQRTLGVLKGTLVPEGFNVGANLGRVAGAGIPDHVHLHVVPRWNGDTNFMPVLGEVKVVNEHLEQTAAKLRQAFSS